MAPPTDGLRVELRQERPIPLAVTLDCQAGEVLALVGPSGSGKSTILRTIAGIYAPQQGRIDAGGETWLDTAAGLRRPAHLRSVGFVFQHYALFPHLSALDNVMQAMGHVPPAERRARALRLIERTHLAGLEERRPARPRRSGGGSCPTSRRRSAPSRRCRGRTARRPRRARSAGPTPRRRAARLRRPAPRPTRAAPGTAGANRDDVDALQSRTSSAGRQDATVGGADGGDGRAPTRRRAPRPATARPSPARGCGRRRRVFR